MAKKISNKKISLLSNYVKKNLYTRLQYVRFSLFETKFSLANKAYLGAGIFVKYCFNLFKYVEKIERKKNIEVRKFFI